MTSKDAIKRIENFGLYHAISDLPNSALTVEAFGKAIELLRLEDEGLLIKLPCKVGDIVYDTTIEQLEKCIVTEIEILRDDIDIRLESNITNGTVSCDDFGKRVFLTRKEAENKLKSLKI